MFQNILKDPKISKRNKSLHFFQCFFEYLFQKNLNPCVFPISYTCLHVILYKYKYMLFHLNMLRLFKRLACLFFFEIKLVSDKKKSPLYT